jgi:hypothetical protein
MNGVIAPYGNERQIDVILGNLNTRKPGDDRWLKSYPNVHLFACAMSSLISRSFPVPSYLTCALFLQTNLGRPNHKVRSCAHCLICSENLSRNPVVP